ncbi:cell division protein FtsW [Halalkalibacter wakoensis JCM 9140]|uniref:Cell division protein FtsW n=1 Tax=Halalkalibacter wakoensis JCM 9140 TaxID=1236970 RepID=W4PYE9_9BACI|nr:cell division protein FtsW [Halalkalibacter wakoensis JCM 9140]
MPKTRTAPDYVLLFTTILLLVIGLIMVYSASAAWAGYRFDDSFFFAKRQLFFAGVGVLAMLFIMRVDYWTWRTWSKVIIIVCFILLVIVLIPGVGLVRGGARSWLGVGAFSIQPSEFMKMAMIAFLAKYLSENQKKIVSFKHGLVPSLSLVMVAFGMIMLQPDLGTGAVMVGTCVVMIFVAGARISHFAWLGVAGLIGFVALIASAPYRIKRITSFLDPWEDPLGSGFQIIQSLYAIGPGGLMGMGLGKVDKSIFIYLSHKRTLFLLY